MRRKRITVALDIELIDGPVPMFHVCQSQPLIDLYLYRDERGRLRAVAPPARPLDAWLGDLPPLAAIIDAAFPEARAA